MEYKNIYLKMKNRPFIFHLQIRLQILLAVNMSTTTHFLAHPLKNFVYLESLLPFPPDAQFLNPGHRNDRAGVWQHCSVDCGREGGREREGESGSQLSWHCYSRWWWYQRKAESFCRGMKVLSSDTIIPAADQDYRVYRLVRAGFH